MNYSLWFSDSVRECSRGRTLPSSCVPIVVLYICEIANFHEFPKFLWPLFPSLLRAARGCLRSPACCVFHFSWLSCIPPATHRMHIDRGASLLRGRSALLRCRPFLLLRQLRTMGDIIVLRCCLVAKSGSPFRAGASSGRQHVSDL